MNGTRNHWSSQKRKRINLFLILMLLGLIGVGGANASLIDRGADNLGNHLIYDSDLNITWYDYSNSVGTWQSQMDWVSALNVSFGGQSYDDWRLPISDGCYSFNCTGSEMGHLYYTELSNQMWPNPLNIVPFQNIGNIQGSWSSTKINQNYSFYFQFFGAQGYELDSSPFFGGIAVRDGDVAFAPVPEPGTMMLLGSGLLGLIGYGRRRFKK